MLYDSLPSAEVAETFTISDGLPMPIAASACEQLHQYNGNEFCNSRCTLEFAHNGSHLCHKGHSF